MERIENDGFFSFRRNARRERARRGEAPKAPDFGSIFQREVEEPAFDPNSRDDVSSEEIEQLLDSIHELGDELLQKGTFTAVQNYREAVKSFVRRTVSQTLNVEEHTSGGNVLNRKRFSIVQVIDQKLDRLVQGMLQSQSSQMELMSRVEEIHGLLVDLSH
ncbi:MAG: DUF327 family protein [Spirochaetes bacterium]|nr:DUF327 family protein [Spirochaetota bacterium]